MRPLLEAFNIAGLNEIPDEDLHNLVYLHAAYAIDRPGLTYTTGNDELHVAFGVQFVDPLDPDRNEITSIDDIDVHLMGSDEHGRDFYYIDGVLATAELVNGIRESLGQEEPAEEPVEIPEPVILPARVGSRPPQTSSSWP